MIYAARVGHLAAVRYLVEDGPEATRVPVDIQNGEALIDAADNNQLEVVNYFLSGSYTTFNEDQCRRAIITTDHAQIKQLLEEYNIRRSN